MISVLIPLLLAAQSLSAYGFPDSRIQEIDYQPDIVIPIEVETGYQVTLLLSPDEQIKSIAVGDSSSWQVSANKSGNNIFVKLAGAGFTTNMTLVTNVRLYMFELIPLNGSSGSMPYIMKFNYPSFGIPDETVNPGAVLGRYKVTGAKSLWPSGIVDDGQRTFIEWPKTSDIPAVYALDQTGHEVLVNGMMRADRLVIESVSSTLVFRIDKKEARASRKKVDATQ